MGVELDRDLRSIQQVRNLLRRAHKASKGLHLMDQEDVDRICLAMVETGRRISEQVAAMAVEETGFGKVEDKILKNKICTDLLWDSIKEMKTVGFVWSDPRTQVYHVAEPMGTVAALVPSTNPTSTSMYKAIIGMKARCPVVVSPHPSAERCIASTCQALYEAGLSAGAPEGFLGWMTEPSLEGTQELMRHELTAVILATGGSAMVKAAYSSGTPAYGVGPGNVPAYIDRTADVGHAVSCVVASKTFDWGTLCSSEQAIIGDAPVFDEIVACLRKEKAHFLDLTEQEQLAKVLVRGRHVNPKIVGRSPQQLAEMAGFKTAPDTRVLVAHLEGVGDAYPLSREKLSPILALYRAADWRAGCQRCIEILGYGGIGHTLVLHCRDPKIIEQFALQKPASRILCNTLSCHGSVGATTGLAPAMTLGCGAWGGSITSDNVTPMHLINIKRLAFGIRDRQGNEVEQPMKFRPVMGQSGYDGGSSHRQPADCTPPSPKPNTTGVTDDQIRALVEQVLRNMKL